MDSHINGATYRKMVLCTISQLQEASLQMQGVKYMQSLYKRFSNKRKPSYIGGGIPKSHSTFNQEAEE